jgi:hypothetical protein
MKMRTVWAVLLLTWLAGCAVPPIFLPPAKPVPEPEPVGRPELSKETLAYLAKRNLTPISGRTLNANADCSFRDENGYGGKLQLAVEGAVVKRLDAQVDVPGHGSCQFRLANFRQTETRPIVILASRQTDCKVSIWEQGDQVTVAFRDCKAECSGDSANYLWPILVDSVQGSCS